MKAYLCVNICKVSPVSYCEPVFVLGLFEMHHLHVPVEHCLDRANLC